MTAVPPLSRVPVGPGGQVLRRLRAFVVVRDQLVRRGLVHVLVDDLDADVVAQAVDESELLAVMATSPPDLVVLDPDVGVSQDAVGLAALVKREHPGTCVVLLVADPDGVDVADVVRSGVDAAVSRSVPSDELCDVVRSAVAGEPTLDHACAGALVRALRAAEDDRPDLLLSDREREVVALLARGHRNRSIAEHLFISESTVKYHLRNVREKLGARSRAEIVSLAMRQAPEALRVVR